MALAEGLGAILVLLTLQFAITFAVSHWAWGRKLFLSKPRLLYQDGSFDEAALRSERVSKQEVISAVREQGLGSIDDAHAVVLESNSVLAVIRKGDGDEEAFDAVTSVRGAEDVKGS